MRFYLGTHKPGWLADSPVPLFVSHRSLADRRTLPRARTGWALDSGGFTELATFGEWRTTPAVYVAAVRRYADQVGRLEWAAPQDWMCEPWIVAKTGRTVRDHQERTVGSYLYLRGELGPVVVPVLQGYELGDYVDHVDQYARAGVDLTAERTVGIGSVCRRQSTTAIAAIVTAVADAGIRLHGFGMKVDGLRRVGGRMTSADSMAWSYAARHRPVRLPGCPHQTCSNCRRWAMRWRADVLAGVGVEPVQGVML